MPKRPSDIIDLAESDDDLPPPFGVPAAKKSKGLDGGASSSSAHQQPPAAVAPIFKSTATTTSTKQKGRAGEAKENASGPATDNRTLLQKIQAVQLDDERVFDNCDHIRKKINDFFPNPDVTKKAFCEEIGGVNSNSLRTFLSYKGPTKGSGSCVYQGAYLFFEKLRIVQNKAKSAPRKRAEQELPDGFTTETGRESCWLPAGKEAYKDEMGRLHVYTPAPRGGGRW